MVKRSLLLQKSPRFSIVAKKWPCDFQFRFSHFFPGYLHLQKMFKSACRPVPSAVSLFSFSLSRIWKNASFCSILLEPWYAATRIVGDSLHSYVRLFSGAIHNGVRTRLFLIWPRYETANWIFELVPCLNWNFELGSLVELDQVKCQLNCSIHARNLTSFNSSKISTQKINWSKESN